MTSGESLTATTRAHISGVTPDSGEVVDGPPRPIRAATIRAGGRTRNGERHAQWNDALVRDAVR
jgi:hypothetical protein